MSERGGKGWLAAFTGILIATLAFAGGAALAAGDEYQEMKFQALQAGRSTANDARDTGEFGAKMINAAPVPSGVYLDVVRITFRPSALSDKQAVCTGTLLHGQHAVLTAGHCSCGITESYRFIAKRTFDGKPDAEPKDASAFRAIREPARFPGFSCAEGVDNSGRDLAVFFIRDIEEQAHETDVQSETLDPDAFTRIVSMHTVYASGARQLTAAGYGITEDGTFSRTLERGRIDIGSYFCSQGSFGGTPCAGFHEFVLGSVSGASQTLPVDTCNGDSGGPVYWYPPEQTADDGTTFLPPPALVGVTSRALLYADHLPGMLCGGGGIYTAVGHSDVLNWLQAYGVQVRTVELAKAPKSN